MRYNFFKGVGKAVLQLIVFGWPFVLTHWPDATNLTIGAAGSIIVNYLKLRFIR